MWNSLSNINFYENLLEQKITGNERLTENDVNVSKICRTCLRESSDTDNLLKEFEIGAMNFNLDGKILKMIDMLRESTGLEVDECDSLPHQICNNCIQNVSGAYFFRMQSREAEKTLQKLISAISDGLEIKYENEQHLDESSREEKPEIVESANDQPLTSDEEDNCELMEIEFNNIHYKIQADFESTETPAPESVIDASEYIIEDQEYEESIEGVQVEYIEKTDDEETKNLENIVIETDSEGLVKTAKEYTKCSECEEAFELKKDLHEHIRTAHPNVKAFECDTCHSRFSNVQTLKRHLKIHQADQQNKLCTFCGKRFTRADDLKRHIRTHTNERPYVCNLCPKRYKQTSELKEHMVTHSREKIYTCEICGKCLLTRNGYYVHMKVHAGVRNHKCNVCGKQYVTSGELNSHFKHIHIKERPFLCSFENCDRKFATKLSLSIHERAHTGERPFPCTICGKRLATSSSLSDHIKLHTGEKKFYCKICHKNFNSSSSLKKHLLRHQLEEKESESNKNDFTCSICGMDFYSADDLSEHEKIHDLESENRIQGESKEVEESMEHISQESEQPIEDLEKLVKEDCQYLMEYSDNEVIQVRIREQDTDQEYLQS